MCFFVSTAQQQLTLLKRASKDHPLATDVASRVLKRLLQDVVASNEVRGCFQTLPVRPRVPTFAEVSKCAKLESVRMYIRLLSPEMDFFATFPPIYCAYFVPRVGTFLLRSSTYLSCA